MQITTPDFILYLFLAITAIQIVYWIFFLAGITKLKTVRLDEKTSLKPISILIAAQNELENLKVLLPLLMEQDHPNYEVIVINDRSSDETYDFLLEQEQQYQKLKVVHIHDLPSHISGKKYALTMGIKAASHKQILFTDADCTPATASWVSQMTSGFNNNADIVLGYSHYKKLPGLLNYFIRFETLKTGLEFIGAAANKLPYMGVGRNLGYKKDLFIENKGFNGFQQLIGGDDDLFINKHANPRNTTCVVGKEALTVSNPKKKISSYWHQKIRHTYVGKYYSFKSKVGIGLFNLSWILFWILAIIGIILQNDIDWIIYAFIFRETLLIITFISATKKLGVAFEFWGLIFLDLLYFIYYIFVGTRALITKTISWR